MMTITENILTVQCADQDRFRRPVFVALLLLLIGLSAACSTRNVKSTTFTPVDAPPAPFQEEDLLDVGIAIFDPGLDELSSKQAELTFADVRRAETYYSANEMANALQTSGHWGVVRVIPHDLSSTDVAIRATILQSDGETMIIRVTVSDSTGREWFEEEYKEIVSKFSYDPRMRRSEDAFQGLYNRISNDMLAWRLEHLDARDIAEIRTVSEIQFARSFAPQAFDSYLTEDRRGNLQIERLPAPNDPVFQRIQVIRERDYQFVDTLQEHYAGFSRQMKEPYTEFRKSNYDQVVKLDQLEKEARRNMILGVAAIVGGLAATQSSNAAASYVTYGAMIAGGFLIKDAIYTNDEAKLHIESLAELGDSLEADIAPQTIELEETTITLTGNVEAQYDQWREILADIYAAEIGEIEADSR